MLEVGKLISDRYALLAPIHEGRITAVWRANDQKQRREVAIKFLFGDDGPDARPGIEQFLREARLVAGIQHRSIVETMESGILEERHAFMVMELLSGEHLGARMAREPRLGAGPFIHVITVALRGLAVVHEAGIVHRDLRPENIFLQRDTEGIYPKILGFGSAVGAARTSRRPSAVAGGDVLSGATPDYMSPEQVRGLSGIDPRSDVYSMAVILFQGLSGRLPFEADTASELIAKIATEQPPQLRELSPELPEPLSELLMQAMSKERDHRFADARAMCNATLSAAKTLLPATRRSSTSLTPVVAAATDTPRGGVQAPPPAPSIDAAGELPGRAAWGDFEGLTRRAAPAAVAAPEVGERASVGPAVPSARDAVANPRLPEEAGRASGAQMRAVSRPSSQQLPAASVGSAAQPTAKRSSAAQLPAVPPAISAQVAPGRQSSAQLPALRSSGAHGAVQPGAPPQPERSSIAERIDPAIAAPRGGARKSIERVGTAAESVESIGADALDPLYAGADQAAPEIDFERIRVDTNKKVSPVRAQSSAGQPGQAPSQVGKQRGKPPSADSARTRRLARRRWLLSLLAVAAIAVAYVAAGGLASPAEPGAAADPTATPTSSPGVDPELRKMRFQMKARRHNPGHMLPHLRDVEF